MSDLLKGGPDPERTLSYLSQREYRPNNALQPRSAILAAIGGMICAIIAASIIFAWHISGIMVMILATGAAQGTILGLLLRIAFRRARLRSLPIAIILCVGCGLVSGTLTYEGLYVKRVHDFEREIRDLAAEKANQPGAPALILNLNQRPYDFFDTFVLRPETGHGGLLGYLLSKKMMKIGGEPTPLFFSYMLNTLLLVWLTFKIGKTQINHPFCEECGSWFGTPKNIAVLPAFDYQQLIDAIQSGDPLAAIAVTRAGAGKELGSGCAVARARRCPRCEGAFVDVVVMLGGNTDRVVMRPVRVTPEMLQALKSEPVVLVKDVSQPPASERSANSAGPPTPSI